MNKSRSHHYMAVATMGLVLGQSGAIQAAKPEITPFAAGATITAEAVNDSLAAITSYVNEVGSALSSVEVEIAPLDDGLSELAAFQETLINDHELRAGWLLDPVDAKNIEGRLYCQDTFILWNYKDIGYASIGWSVFQYEDIYFENNAFYSYENLQEPIQGFSGNPFNVTLIENTAYDEAKAQYGVKQQYTSLTANDIRGIFNVGSSTLFWAGGLRGTYDPPTDGKSIFLQTDFYIQCGGVQAAPLASGQSLKTAPTTKTKGTILNPGTLEAQEEASYE
jgi:hypothetical protein